MSTDSSSLPIQVPVTPQKTRQPWGVGGAIFFSLLALFGPVYVIEPFLAMGVGNLPLDDNIKNSILISALLLLSLGVMALVLRGYRAKPRDIGIAKPSLSHLGKAAVCFLVYIAASLLVANIAQHIPGFNQNQSQDLGYVSPHGADLIAGFVQLLIITPLAEETIFRGFMFAGIRRHAPFWLTAIVVSALFGLAHGQWNVGLDVSVMSLVSCYLRERSGSLWPSIFLHMLKNGVAFYLLYLYTGG